jgi:hypothetical protein
VFRGWLTSVENISGNKPALIASTLTVLFFLAVFDFLTDVVYRSMAGRMKPAEGDQPAEGEE